METHATAGTTLRTRRAFTLVELIVVVVILGLLAGVGAFAYNQVTESSRKHAARAIAHQFARDLAGVATNRQSVVSALVTDPADPDVTAARHDVGASGASVQFGKSVGGAVVAGVSYREYCTPVLFSATTPSSAAVGQTVKAAACHTDTGALDGSTGAGTDPGTPTTPTNVRVVTATGTGVTLAWDPVDGATSYTVYVDNAATASWTGSATTVTLTELSHSAHTARVSSSVAGTESGQSDPVPFTTEIRCPDGGPVSVRVVKGGSASAVTMTVTIDWGTTTASYGTWTAQMWVRTTATPGGQYWSFGTKTLTPGTSTVTWGPSGSSNWNFAGLQIRNTGAAEANMPAVYGFGPGTNSHVSNALGVLPAVIAGHPDWPWNGQVPNSLDGGLLYATFAPMCTYYYGDKRSDDSVPGSGWDEPLPFTLG